MTGRYHKKHNLVFGMLIVLLAIIYFNYPIQYLLSIPIIYFTATFPDIDQAEAVPGQWKPLKTIFSIFITLIPVIAIISLIIYGFSWYNKKGTLEDLLIHIVISIGILILYILLNVFKKTKQGAFLWAHRGFTHTGILPLVLTLIFIQLQNMLNNNEGLLYYLIYGLNIIVFGFIIGILGHDFLDLTCKRGIPFFWPIPFIGLNMKTKRPVNIHIGWAITSDKRSPDGVHASSKIYTYVLMVIYLIIIVRLLFVNQSMLLNLLQNIVK